jgi:hypothetical protein
MSDAIEQYRRMAVNARADALAATLPNVQELDRRSDYRLEEIVRGMEKVSLAKSANDEAKRCASAAANCATTGLPRAGAELRGRLSTTNS